MDRKVKIIVCCHKEGKVASEEPYMPIHVGKCLSDKDLGIQGDDTGQSISHKNGSYCELTGMYWAWKNLGEADIVGLCHYRRYFDFHGQISRWHESDAFRWERFDEIDLSIPEDILERIRDGVALAPNKRWYITDLYHDYCFCHISEDLKTLGRVIKKETPDYWDAFNRVMWENNGMSHYNMFIMSRKDFDIYSDWLFRVLGEVECQTDISNYKNGQDRIYGFMGERLLNVYFRARNIKVIRRPVILFDDNTANTSTLNLMQKRVRGWLASRLSRRLDKNYDI